MIEDDIKILSHLYSINQPIKGRKAFQRIENYFSNLNRYTVSLETCQEYINSTEYLEEDTSFKLWCEKKSKEKT